MSHYKIIKLPLKRNKQYLSFCVCISSDIMFTLVVQQAVHPSPLT